VLPAQPSKADIYGIDSINVVRERDGAIGTNLSPISLSQLGFLLGEVVNHPRKTGMQQRFAGQEELYNRDGRSFVDLFCRQVECLRRHETRWPPLPVTGLASELAGVGRLKVHRDRELWEAQGIVSPEKIIEIHKTMSVISARS
jgi:hypothetical protein